MSERDPLLRITSSSQPTMKPILSRARLLAPINTTHADLTLLACCVVTGMLDCAVFNNYGVFVGMQTGNTIILCLSTAGLPRSQPYSYATTLVSLASFAVGAFVTAHVSQFLGALRRAVITANFATQALCIVVAAIVTTLDLTPVNNRDQGPSILGDPRIIGALPALAFQSGATIATSRLLGFGNEIPVNVLTSTYAALATDPAIFAAGNVARNRRVVAVVCVLVGALCSAWIMKDGPGIVLVLWLGAGVKGLIALGVFWLLGSKEEEVSG